jgi:hypothetical protein
MRCSHFKIRVSKPSDKLEDISESDSSEQIDMKPKLPRYHTILKPPKRVQKYIPNEIVELVQIDQEESILPS